MTDRSDIAHGSADPHGSDRAPAISTARDEVLLVERRGAVMLAILNRPEARNAVNAALHLALGEALEEAATDPDVRVVIVTGAGDHAFCAGADLKAVGRGESILPNDPIQRGWGFGGIVTHPIGKPIICAINGAALGGGTEIALSCDLIVAADTATLGLPEVKRGVIAAAGGAFRLLDHLPRKIAMEYVLTGEPMTAADALRHGLVNAVVPRDRLIDAAMALAERIAANAPLAVQATKRIANRIADGRIAREDEAWAITHAEIPRVLESEDHREGVRAFIEKRAPRWMGR